MTSWMVHATVREPVELLVAFAAHYLDLGAEQVHLFLDDACAEKAAILGAMDGVRVTLCDAAHWSRAGGQRPHDQEVRQSVNAQLSYSECRTDWFLYCDADEFAVARESFAAILGRVPGDQAHCRLRVAERVFHADRPQRGLFDGPIRKGIPGDPALLQAVYGDAARYLTVGLSGHSEGKSFVRRGTDLRLWLHFPRPRWFPRLNTLLRRAALQGPMLSAGWLVHFDGLTPLHWQIKLLRYAQARDAAFGQRPPVLRAVSHLQARIAGQARPRFRPQTRGRDAQLAAIADPRRTPADMATLLGAVCLSDESVAKLRQSNALLGLRPTPRRAAEAHVPGSGARLTAAAIDSALRRDHASLIADYGLRIASPPGDSGLGPDRPNL